MKTRLWLFFFVLFMAVFSLSVLCQADKITLSTTSANHTVTTGSDDQVYGTSASNQIILESGARAELINFPGQNAIQIQSTSDLFNVSRSGTVVTFQGSDGTLLKIPATTDIQTISFTAEESRVLQIHNGQVMLDDQEITSTPASIECNQDEPVTCGAYVAPGVWKEFDCYNLAAIGKTTNDDPLTPSWRIIGGYWQWGQKGPDPSVWHYTNTGNFAHGPTGPSDSDVNSASISGWASDVPYEAWSDSSKTANDPCPDGFRVPTKAQWQGVVDNNTRSTVGTWSTTWNDHTNYSSARFFGNDLMLPVAGYRDGNLGSMSYRGYSGYYWSSSEDGSGYAWYLYLDIGGADTKFRSRRSGLSVRCVADDSSQPLPLSLGKNTLSLESGNSETITISGGTGYYTVITNNSQVASVVISGSNLEITGLSSGAATITVSDTGGETASISVTVSSSTSPSGKCGAYVAPGVWKEFDCYNLAAIGKTTSADPFIPSWRLIGGYWQWGRKGPSSSQWYNTNTEHFAHGPTGPGDSEANDGAISGWDDSDAPDGSWSDSYKTANDPCPSGYRVPTEEQWRGVVDNNTQSTVGTWDSDDTNYSSGRFFGSELILPAAGFRYYYDSGALAYRGHYGHYWSSSGHSSNYAWNLNFPSGNADTPTPLNYYRRFGFSVRCVAE